MDMNKRSEFNKILKDIKEIRIQGARDIAKAALKAYRHICIKYGLWHPNFWKYSDLRIRYNF